MQERDKLGVKYAYPDRGNFRHYYRPVDKKDKRLFCIQIDELGEATWYLCSKDGEPSHKEEGLDIWVVD